MGKLFSGRGSNGVVELDVDGLSMTLQHVDNIATQNCFYVVMKSLASGEVQLDNGLSVKPGQKVIFEFDGDLGTYSGYYRPLTGDEKQRAIAAYTGGNPKPSQPQQNRPQPSQPQAPRTIQQQTGYVRHNAIANEGGMFWKVMRNINYVLAIILGIGIIFGVLSGLGYLIIKGYAQNGDVFWTRALDPNVDFGEKFPTLAAAAGLASPAALFFILCPANAIVCLVEERDMAEFSTYHNGIIIIGLVNVNPFAILGGWCNYRYCLHRYKMKPVREGQ